MIFLLDMVKNGMYNKKRQDKETLLNDKSLLSSPSLPWTLSCLITFKGIRWIYFSLSLVLSPFFFFFFCHVILRKDSCCPCKHDHPFSYALPVVICFRILPLFEGEMCKDEEFQRRHQLLCFAPAHSAGISSSKLLLVAPSPSKYPALF